jgi:hypothetical protein
MLGQGALLPPAGAPSGVVQRLALPAGLPSDLADDITRGRRGARLRTPGTPACQRTADARLRTSCSGTAGIVRRSAAELARIAWGTRVRRRTEGGPNVREWPRRAPGTAARRDAGVQVRGLRRSAGASRHAQAADCSEDYGSGSHDRCSYGVLTRIIGPLMPSTSQRSPVFNHGLQSPQLRGCGRPRYRPGAARNGSGLETARAGQEFDRTDP